MSRSASQCHALVTKQSAAPRGSNASYHRLRNSCGGSLSTHRSTSFGASCSAVGRSARSYWSAISSPRTALSIMGVIALERLSPSLAPNSHSKSRSCEIRHMETFEEGTCRGFSWCEQTLPQKRWRLIRLRQIPTRAPQPQSEHLERRAHSPLRFNSS